MVIFTEVKAKLWYADLFCYKYISETSNEAVWQSFTILYGVITAITLLLVAVCPSESAKTAAVVASQQVLETVKCEHAIMIKQSTQKLSMNTYICDIARPGGVQVLAWH